MDFFDDFNHTPDPQKELENEMTHALLRMARQAENNSIYCLMVHLNNLYSTQSDWDDVAEYVKEHHPDAWDRWEREHPREWSGN